MKCILCDCTNVIQVFNLEKVGVHQCSKCGILFVYPFPKNLQSSSSGEFSIMTDDGYSESLLNDSSNRRTLYNTIATNRYHYYAAILGNRKFSLLEIGCGSAGLAGSFNKLGVAYYGIDIDQIMTSKAASDGIANIRNIDFFDIDENERYDVVCASQVLEHITKPDEFIAKIYKHLNKNGVIHIDVPNHESLAGMVQKLLRSDKNRYGEIRWPHHSISYKRETLEFLLHRHFSEVKTFSINSNHKTWGQVGFPSTIRKFFLLVSAILRRHNFLVTLGTKRCGTIKMFDQVKR